MEKLFLGLGALAALKAPAAKVVLVGDKKEVKIKSGLEKEIELTDDSMVRRHINEKKSQLMVAALGPVPSPAFTKALKEENRRELEKAGYFIDDDNYKAPTMRSNIKKGKRH